MGVFDFALLFYDASCCTGGCPHWCGFRSFGLIGLSSFMVCRKISDLFQASHL